MELQKTEKINNKVFDLGLSLLKLSKILMYEFSYDYLKPKSGVKSKFNERKIMRKFFGLTAKIYSYLRDGSSEDKKAKGKKKVCDKKKT